MLTMWTGHGPEREVRSSLNGPEWRRVERQCLNLGYSRSPESNVPPQAGPSRARHHARTQAEAEHFAKETR